MKEVYKLSWRCTKSWLSIYWSQHGWFHFEGTRMGLFFVDPIPDCTWWNNSGENCGIYFWELLLVVVDGALGASAMLEGVSTVYMQEALPFVWSCLATSAKSYLLEHLLHCFLRDSHGTRVGVRNNFCVIWTTKIFIPNVIAKSTTDCNGCDLLRALIQSNTWVFLENNFW